MENLATSIPYLSVVKDRKLAGGDGEACSPSTPPPPRLTHIFILSPSTFYPSLCFPCNLSSSTGGMEKGTEGGHSDLGEMLSEVQAG